VQSAACAVVGGLVARDPAQGRQHPDGVHEHHRSGAALRVHREPVLHHGDRRRAEARAQPDRPCARRRHRARAPRAPQVPRDRRHPRHPRLPRRPARGLGTRAIIDYQYRSINRGEHSIYGQLAARGIDAAEYLFVFNLRTYDRLHTTAGLREREERAGVSYSAAVGDHAEAVGGGKRRPDILAHSPAMLVGQHNGPSLSSLSSAASKPERVEVGDGNAPAKDTVAADAMRDGTAANIADERWDDDEEHEKLGFIQE
jgi:hypothetical protein